MTTTPDGLSPRSTRRGRRPRAASSRDDPCARCGRNIPRLAARWPEGRLCFTCYNTAIHTHGTCPNCCLDRLLPGPPVADGEPVGGTCAGIDIDFHCQRCGVEAGHHRGNLCARCVLREDLHALLGGAPENPPLAGLIDALCAADRPESIITWKRSPKVQRLLTGLGEGSIPCTHEGLDTVGGNPAEHLRALLQHHDLLPPRDPYLPQFEHRIAAKLDGSAEEVRQPVHRFATWHHLRRIRDKAAAGTPTRAPIHSAKQENTETIKFLSWLQTTYGRTAATCTQPDIDEWLATGPSTRQLIRTFFVVAKKARLNTTVTVGHRAARSSPSLTQDQRIAWIYELLTGNSEALPYRVAGTLLLLYARPSPESSPCKSPTSRTSPTVWRSHSAPVPPTCPNHSPDSCEPTWPRARTCAPAPATTAPGCCPALSPDDTSTPPPSPTGSEASASTCAEHATEPWPNSSSNAHPHSSPTPWATATRSPSSTPIRQRNNGPAMSAVPFPTETIDLIPPRPSCPEAPSAPEWGSARRSRQQTALR
ncbi:hypothetical protein [Dietzia sp. SLG310A2-38A2]|uniref:hypothetical protein n=1 Tax=Dietzia sp. SLG310A2-38A2 TaxID=1630643 RepID=UPI0032192A0B